MKKRQRIGVWVGMGVVAYTGLAGAITLPVIKMEQYTLPNGLHVILREDHTVPVVAVNVWYHVGSHNEKPGRTGFAHLFEHMMFQGSQHHDADYFPTLQKIGSNELNGTTGTDTTNYYEVVPKNYLEKALWLEADRMGFLLPAMTQKKLDNQRDVVKNERRQRNENQPYGMVMERMMAMMHPSDHPYAWMPIGSMADLSAASLSDVSEFFKLYYAPNNASLCIVGDFATADTKRWIERYFAPIPSGPPIERLTAWIPNLEGVRRAVMQDRVKLPKVYLAWHTPAHYAVGDAELDLFANVLADGKSSRLYKSLVYEKQIAQDVSAYQWSRELGSVFLVEVTGREGVSLSRLEEETDAIIRKAVKEGVTVAELAQAQAQYGADFVRGLERANGLADQLNRYQTMLGEANRFQWDLDRYTEATTKEVQRVAKQWLGGDRRVIFHVTPHQERPQAEDRTDRTVEPGGQTDVVFAPPRVQRETLKNGLEILLVEDHRLPLVNMKVIIKSGRASDPADRPGVASLAAELLDEGTSTRTALQIDEAFKRIGADLSISCSGDGTFIGLNVLKKHFAHEGLPTIANILRFPTFPQDELERIRKTFLARLQQESSDPNTIAQKTFLHALYGPTHPYGRTSSGTVASIKAVQREDLVAFYRVNYLPNNAAVVVSGDLTMAELKGQLESALSGWASGPLAVPDLPPPAPVKGTAVYLVDMPGAAQSMIIMGHAGIRRADPDLPACEVVNDVLGGGMMSRLNGNLREEKGYTYGCQSVFRSGRGVGPFMIFAPVQTQSTKESLVEMMKELRGLTGLRPPTEVEVADSKNGLIKGFPESFGTMDGVVGELSQLVMYGLPADEWVRYLTAVGSVTPASAAALAKARVHPDACVIVVVGDLAKIEAGVRELKLGEVTIVQAP